MFGAGGLGGDGSSEAMPNDQGPPNYASSDHHLHPISFTFAAKNMREKYTRYYGIREARDEQSSGMRDQLRIVINEVLSGRDNLSYLALARAGLEWPSWRFRL